jgi:hypothetical protein
MVYKMCQPKVPKLSIECRIKHHIAWLNITVHNTLLPLLVEVQESGCNANSDLGPQWPC